MDFDGNKMEKAFLVNLKKTKTKKPNLDYMNPTT